jgi:hypothetical protein
MSRTLNDYLTQAGVKLAAKADAPAAPEKTAAPAAKTAAPAKTVAAPAKVADIAPAMPTTEAGDGHKPRVKKTDAEAHDTGKTAAQVALESRGIVVADEKIAEALHQDFLKKAEAEKRAELQKLAAEERARGALLYQGMIAENTAWNLATKEASLADAAQVAAGLGIELADIVKRAEQIGGAMTSPALVGGMLGSAARTDNSVVMRKGEETKEQVETRDVEAIAGTRAPATGNADEKLKRFTDVATLPGNPGLNHGQAVDQGKGLGA